jgi:hypothetical protein
MPLPNKIQGAFTGGELAPALWGRPDLAKYSVGAKTLRNVFVQVEGGASNRAGTQYVFDLGEPGYFIPFEFNQSQTAGLVLYAGKIMFLHGGQVVVTNLVSSSDGYEWKESTAKAGEYYFQKTGDAPPGISQPKTLYEQDAEMLTGTVGALAEGCWGWGDHDSLGFDTLYVKVTGGGDPDSKAEGWLQIPYVIESPYAMADVPRIRFVQQYDTLLFTCRGYEQRQLVRYDHTDWRWEAQETAGGPLGSFNSEPGKLLSIALEVWDGERKYNPGRTVTNETKTLLTASWIGTTRSYNRNPTIKADCAIGAYDYKTLNAPATGVTRVFPYTLIRVAKGSTLTVGKKIRINLTFTESSGLTTYEAETTINALYTGTTYQYIRCNLGWEFAYRSTPLRVEDAWSSPRGNAVPSYPAGVTFTDAGVAAQSEYDKRLFVMMYGTNTANGGGALTSAVSGNVVQISAPTTAYLSIAQSENVEPEVATDWALSWQKLGSVPSEVVNVEISSSGFAPFTENDVGRIVALVNDTVDKTGSYSWAIGTSYSTAAYMLGEITFWTEGTWAGKVYLQKSLDDGETWSDIVSIHSNSDHNGSLTREIFELGTMVRVKGVITTATCKVYIRSNSTYSNVFKIVQFISSGSVVGVQQSGAVSPFSTSLWALGYFGDSSGWPNSVTMHQQRVFYGGTSAFPKKIWGSRSGNYVNFAASDMQLSTEPIDADISLAKQYEIRHLVPLKSLLILTSGSWHSLSGTDGSLTPTNGEVTLHGYGGVSDKIRPLIAGLSVLCVQDDDRTISELRYSLASDGYDRTEEMGIFSKHLFRGKKITGWTYQKDPNDLILVTMSDGGVLPFTFLREQEVWAWCRWDTDGEFLQVGSVKSSDELEDEVYFIVKRTINGVERHFIEYLTPRLPDSQMVDGVFMDCSVTYEGSPATVIQGLKHLEGKAVAVLADGKVINGKTVSGGQITLEMAASKVHVGLPYVSDIQTLNLELGESTTSQGRKKAVRKVVLRCHDTKGFKVGPSVDKLTVPNEWDKLAAGKLFTGDVDIRIKGDWNTEGAVFIRQADPLPMTINAVIPFFELGE